MAFFNSDLLTYFLSFFFGLAATIVINKNIGAGPVGGASAVLIFAGLGSLIFEGYKLTSDIVNILTVSAFAGMSSDEIISETLDIIFVSIFGAAYYYYFYKNFYGVGGGFGMCAFVATSSAYYIKIKIRNMQLLWIS